MKGNEQKYNWHRPIWVNYNKRIDQNRNFPNGKMREMATKHFQLIGSLCAGMISSHIYNKKTATLMPKGYRCAVYNIFWLFNCHSNAFNLKLLLLMLWKDEYTRTYQVTREWKYLITTEEFANCPDNPLMIADNVKFDGFFFRYQLLTGQAFEVRTCIEISNCRR